MFAIRSLFVDFTRVARSMAGRCRLVLIGLLFTCAMPLLAQTNPPPSQAQMDRDVQLLLKNDEDVAAARQKLTAREITNVEYTRQTQALTAARTEIVKPYDRAAYARLLALYNAAKRDQQLAAADAARKAAAEAREKAAAEAAAKRQAAADAAAKAAAEKEATRLAAVAEAQAKAATAKAAAEALTKEVEDDAQAAVKAMLRQQELSFKQRAGLISPPEQQELPNAGNTAVEISKKYATGGALAARARDFQQKTNQLYTSQSPAANREWIIAAFPDPAKVTAAFSDETRRAAAFEYMQKLMTAKLGTPLPESANQKMMAYRVAIDGVNATMKGKLSAKDYTAYYQKTVEMARDQEFQLDVHNKCLPVYGAEVANKVNTSKQLASQQAFQAKVSARTKRLTGALSVYMMALLGFAVFMAMRKKSVSPAPAAANDPFQLPEALRVVKVFRREYPVAFEAGQVYEKEAWTETNVTTTTTGGGSYVAGGMVHSTPSQTSTHVSTTVYHKYWIRTPDGRETWYTFADNVLPASKGHTISAISRGTSVMLAYNHNTGEFGTLKAAMGYAHQFRSRWIILIVMGLWIAGALAITTVLGGGDEMGARRSSDYVQGGFIGIAVLTCIIMFILKIVLVLIRNSQFKSRYLPQFRKFMEQCTPELARRLPPSASVSQA